MNAAQDRWAILIGINEYQESLGPLSFCANDATLMHETLVSDCCGFSPDNIVLLTDDQAEDRLPTFGNIHSWLGTWLSRPGPDDLVLVYFAGHGREENGQALLAPMDATLESLPVTGIPVGNLVDMLERCRAAQKVLLLDACHSGAGRDVATMSSEFRAAIDTGKGLYTIASCDADQISYEWPEKQHGVFTYCLVEALRHGAPVGVEGCVTLDAVYESSRAGILDWTAGKRLKQEPVRICRTKGDIHIATRSLSVEQQLVAARDQVRGQEETIRRLSEEAERLSQEREKTSRQLTEIWRTQKRLSGRLLLSTEHEYSRQACGSNSQDIEHAIAKVVAELLGWKREHLDGLFSAGVIDDYDKEHLERHLV